jgi:hypothetical protein
MNYVKWGAIVVVGYLLFRHFFGNSLPSSGVGTIAGNSTRPGIQPYQNGGGAVTYPSRLAPATYLPNLPMGNPGAGTPATYNYGDFLAGNFVASGPVLFDPGPDQLVGLQPRGGPVLSPLVVLGVNQ